jgi:hypothetical protein
VGEIVTPSVDLDGNQPSSTTRPGHRAFFVRPPYEVPDRFDRRMVADRHWRPPDLL